MKVQMSNAKKVIFGIAAICVGCLFVFQNCAKIDIKDIDGSSSGNSGVGVSLAGTISLQASPMSVVVGQGSTITVNYDYLTNVTYRCKDKSNGQIMTTGSVNGSGGQIALTVDRDLTCEASGTFENQNYSASVDISVICGNLVKNSGTGRCEQFVCKSTVEIKNPTELAQVSARTSNGTCYSYKLLNAIANSPASLTRSNDGDIISRNHDNGTGNIFDVHAPYLMGESKPEFRISGPRVVKLSGSADGTSPILVDNFILVGLYPSDANVNANLKTYYRAMGTSDSTVGNNSTRQDSKSILFKNTEISVTAFAQSGTSSVTPVDLSTSISLNKFYTLDLRALDCGSIRELSNVYLVFQ